MIQTIFPPENVSKLLDLHVHALPTEDEIRIFTDL